MSTPDEFILDAYETLKRRVEDALHTQLGDRARLQVHQRDARELLRSFDHVRTAPSLSKAFSR